MKKLAKNAVASILGWQVQRLRVKHDFKVVAIAGSVGKTSTKLAIANVLSQKYRLRTQDGNYNDLISVPLIFFGGRLPSLYNPLAWLRIFWQNYRQLKAPYPYDIVVVEVGTDAPGQIKQFAKYLKADIGVLTAIAPEHMEFFADLEAVANEELALANFSEKLLINIDLVAAKYLERVKIPFLTYAIQQAANTRIKNLKFNDQDCDFDVERNGQFFFHAAHELVSEPQVYSVCAAIAVGAELGMNPTEIEHGIRNIRPVSGRMQRLVGINNSIIIDDSYNASPQAAKAAIQTLYRLKAPQKIAILGNMNELGPYSPAAHREIGEFCDPGELDLIITIGPDANQYLAPAAVAKGCRVKSFNNPYEAGRYVKTIIKPGAAILVKGSQNLVYAEEAIKFFLAHPQDESKLVRQSQDWLNKKSKTFTQAKA